MSAARYAIIQRCWELDTSPHFIRKHIPFISHVLTLSEIWGCNCNFPANDGSTFNQHWFNVSRLLGSFTAIDILLTFTSARTGKQSAYRHNCNDFVTSAYLSWCSQKAYLRLHGDYNHFVTSAYLHGDIHHCLVVAFPVCVDPKRFQGTLSLTKGAVALPGKTKNPLKTLHYSND